MHKRLCACGCGERVTPKVESQHLNALAPALLTSQVLDQNQRLIQRKKRSQPVGFPAPLRQQLVMGNTTNSSTMMGEDLDYKVYGQSRSGHSRRIAPHAGPSGLSHDDEDIVMDYSAPSISPRPDDDAKVYGLSNLRRSRRIADAVEKIGQQRWGSNASVQFVNDEGEEDPNMEDEPISDSDIASDEEDDDDMFAGPGQEGISLWDSLGEGFLREVSQLGMLFWYHYYFYYSKHFNSGFRGKASG